VCSHSPSVELAGSCRAYMLSYVSSAGCNTLLVCGCTMFCGVYRGMRLELKPSQDPPVETGVVGLCNLVCVVERV
jgi:hypothetical protein